MVAAGRAQSGQVGLGVALVFAAQRIREGHVFHQPLLGDVIQWQCGFAAQASHGIDHRAGYVVERLCAARAEVEDAALGRMVKEPEVDRHHIVDEHKVAHLAPLRVASVFAEELDLAFRVELVELVEGHTGHAALVLLARAVDVEIYESPRLGGYGQLWCVQNSVPHSRRMR